MPSYEKIIPGKFVRWHFEVQSATQAYHWDWFGSWGLPAGDYEITLIYDYPCKELSGDISPEKIFEYEKEKDAKNVWHGQICSNTVSFTVDSNSVYGDYLPVGETTQVITKNEYGIPQQVAFIKEGKIIRESFYGMDEYVIGQPVYLAFEMTYGKPPNSPATWNRKGLRIPSVGGGATSFEWFVPEDNQATGKYTQWCPIWYTDCPVLRISAYYKNGLLHGTFKSGDYQGDYIEGKKEGHWYIGNKRIRLIENYKNGKLHGDRYSYHKNGNLMKEEHYENGLQIGITKSWSKEGIITRHEHYVNGKKHGTFERFSGNGQIKEHKEFIMDVPTGIWIWYGDEGQILAKGEWKEGERYNGTFFDNGILHTGEMILYVYEEGKLIETKRIKTR